MERSASEINARLAALRRELEQLAAQGRLSMDPDTWNVDYRDLEPALRDALAGLEQALKATRWMTTAPDPTGEYPPLEG